MTAINEPVSFTATLKAGNTILANKPVSIWHTLNNVRYTDVTKNTDAKGQITLTQTFKSAGTRPYYAEFLGDATYAKSVSPVVNIVVTEKPLTATTIKLEAMDTRPLVNVPTKLTATLSTEAGPLAGKSVIIYHTLQGQRYDDVNAKTDAEGKITLTQSWTSHCIRPYFAEFKGDSEYKAFVTPVLNIYVTQPPETKA